MAQSSYVPAIPTTASGTLSNDGFFPNLDIADFVASTRLNDTIPQARIENHLIVAMLDTNNQLSSLRVDDKFITDSDPQIAGKSQKLVSYQRAVYSLAWVYILQEMRDYDYTNQGETTDLAEAIDDQQANHTCSVRGLLGKSQKFIKLV